MNLSIASQVGGATPIASSGPASRPSKIVT
jgi:hypothetical protein